MTGSEICTRRRATGLDYAMNRSYSSGWGRFGSPDPYQASGGPATPGSWNRYAYASGDSVNFNDPKGLASCLVGAITTVFNGVGSTNLLYENCPDGSAPDYARGMVLGAKAQWISRYAAWAIRQRGYAAFVNASNFAVKSNLDSDRCKKDREALGVKASDLSAKAGSLDPVDAYSSLSPIAKVSEQTPDYAGQTVSDFFANNPGTTALAGNQTRGVVYIDPAIWGGYTVGNGLNLYPAFGEVLHEALHFLGKTDLQIGEALLGYDPGDNTDIFSQRLSLDCFLVGGK